MTRRIFLRSALLACLALSAGPLQALDCSNDAGLAAARQSRYVWAEWCSACGGEVITGPECRPGPNWGGRRAASAGAVDPAAQRLLEQSVNYGVQTNDVGGAMMGIGAAMFMQGMQDAQRQSQAAEQQRREAARLQALREAEERERARQAQYNRIMAELDDSGAPQPADVEGVPVAGAALPSAATSNPLGLMDDEPLPASAAAGAGGAPAGDARFLRGTAPHPRINRPPVTHLPATPVAANAEAATDAASAPPPPPAPAPAPVPAPAPNTPPPVTQGMRDASQCLQSRGALVCLNAPDRAACQASYDQGYASGSVKRDTSLQAAYQRGVADKRAGLPLQAKVAFNSPDASGPCRIEWINAYSRGYAEGR